MLRKLRNLFSALNSSLSRLQKNVLILLFGFLLGLIPGWYPILKDLFSPVFKAQMPTVMMNGFQSINCGKEDWIKQDLDMAVYLRVTNNSNTDAEITNYHLEIKSSEGWMQLRNFTVTHPYSIGSTINSRLFVFDVSNNSFDLQTQSTAIQPGHSIEGWAFFNSNLKIQGNGLFRLTLFDNKDNITKIKIPFPKLNEAQPFFRSGNFIVLSDDHRPRCHGH
jgi:hypothetical protein